MPRYCCIPYCTSNRPGKPYVSAFRFPKSRQQLQLWKEKIPRSFEHTNNSVVCIKHFPESFIIRSDKFTDKDGNVREFARVNPKLARNAYPCIFPSCSTYFNEEVKEQLVTIECKKELEQLDDEEVKEQSVTIECKKEMKQLDEGIMEQAFTVECKKEMEQLDDQENKKITSLNTNKINCLEYLKEKLLSPENILYHFLTKNNILVHTCENCISFLFVNCEDCPFIQKSLKVDKNLTINSFNFKNEIKLPLIKKILSHPPKLTYFSELLNILTILNCFKIESHDANSIDLHDSKFNSAQINNKLKKRNKKMSAKHSRNVKKCKTC